MNSIKERATATKILCFYCPRMVHTSQKGKDPSTTPLKMAFNINMTCGTSEYTHNRLDLGSSCAIRGSYLIQNL